MTNWKFIDKIGGVNNHHGYFEKLSGRIIGISLFCLGLLLILGLLDSILFGKYFREILSVVTLIALVGFFAGIILIIVATNIRKY